MRKIFALTLISGLLVFSICRVFFHKNTVDKNNLEIDPSKLQRYGPPEARIDIYVDKNGDIYYIT